MIELNLPPSYKYKFVRIKDNICFFRVKEIRDKEATLEWIKKFGENSQSVWKILRSYKPEVPEGRVNVFKVDYRCEHNNPNYRPPTSNKLSKNTDCPALLKITVQRYFSMPNCKDPEPVVQDFPTMIELRFKHNHLLGTPAMRLYRRKLEAANPKKQHNVSIPIDFDQPESNGESASVSSDPFTDIDTPDSVSPNSSEPATAQIISPADLMSNLFPATNTISDHDCIKKFESLVSRIRDGYRKRPSVFMPALRNMVHNADSFPANNDAGLVSALNTFGAVCPTILAIHPMPDSSFIVQ